MLGLCTYATKPYKNCTTYTAQLLQYSMTKYKVQTERSAASKQLVCAFCASANMASQQCVKTIMNIIQVLWRTAPTVAVPARAREPENSAPTDLQEGYKIDKYMYVYKRKKIQLIHVTMDNTYIMLDANICTPTRQQTHTSHVCMHTHTHTHTHVTCMHACTHTDTHTHVTCMHAHTRRMYACTHTHTHRMYACTNIRHMYACTHTDTHTHTHTSHVCMHKYTSHVCIHAHRHTHVTCMHAHTHTSHVCTHTHIACMHAHTHTHIACMHAHTHTHTHTHVACMHAHTHRLCTMFQ